MNIDLASISAHKIYGPRGVGALRARTAVIGAYFNVRNNSKDIKDKNFTEEIVSKAEKIYKQAIQKEKEIITFIDLKM